MIPPPLHTPQTSRLLTLPIPILHTVISHLIMTCVDANDQLPTKGTVTRFHAKERPPLEIGAYLSRLTTYTPFPRDAIILSLLFLDRITRLPLDKATEVEPGSLSHVHPTPLFPSISRSPPGPLTFSPLPSTLHNDDQKLPSLPSTPAKLTLAVTAASPFSPPLAPLNHPPTPGSGSNKAPRPPSPAPLLNSYTLHRLMAATLLVSSKFSSDGFIPQTRAAKVAGVEKQELVRLEVEILKALKWTLYFEMEDVEAISACVLKVGEDIGMVEPVVAVVEPEEEETTADSAEDDTSLREDEDRKRRTSLDGAPSLRPTPTSDVSPSSSAASSCIFSSHEQTSPLLSNPPGRSSPTPPSSPPTPSGSPSPVIPLPLKADYVSDLDASLAKTASNETMRMISKLSVGDKSSEANTVCV